MYACVLNVQIALFDMSASLLSLQFLLRSVANKDILIKCLSSLVR